MTITKVIAGAAEGTILASTRLSYMKFAAGILGWAAIQAFSSILVQNHMLQIKNMIYEGINRL